MLLQILEGLQLSCGLGGAACLAIQRVHLEVCCGQQRIQFRSPFKAGYGVCRPALLAIQGSQLVVNDRLFRGELQHRFELSNGRSAVACLAVLHAEVEPGVR